MWDGIAPTDEYLCSHIPLPIWQFVLEEGDEDATLPEEEAEEEGSGRPSVAWAKCYCIAGCVLALGIARAGHVHDTVSGLYVPKQACADDLGGW
jgi:hypothetical protein